MQKTFTASEIKVLELLGVGWIANYTLKFDVSTILADASMGRSDRANIAGNRCDAALWAAYINATPAVQAEVGAIGAAEIAAQIAASTAQGVAEREAIAARVAAARAAGPQVGDQVRALGGKKKQALGVGTILEVTEHSFKIEFASGARYIAHYDVELA